MSREHLEMDAFEQRVADVIANDTDAGAFGYYDELTERRLMNDVLEKARAPQSGSRDRRFLSMAQRRRGAAIVGGIAAAAVALVLYKDVPQGQAPTAIDASNAVSTTGGRLVQGGNDLIIGGQAMRANAMLPLNVPIRSGDERALFALPTGIEWMMEPRTILSITQENKQALQILVTTGTVWFQADPIRVGPPFSVLTPKGRINVKGTIFVVRVVRDDVRVQLLRGRVLVDLANDESTPIETGFELDLSKARQTPILDAQLTGLNSELFKLGWRENPD